MMDTRSRPVAEPLLGLREPSGFTERLKIFSPHPSYSRTQAWATCTIINISVRFQVRLQVRENSGNSRRNHLLEEYRVIH